MNNLLKISMEKLLERTDSDITDITQSITEAYSIAGGLDDSNIKDAILVNLEQAFTSISDWQKYYHHFNEITLNNYDSNKDIIVKQQVKIEMLQSEIEKQQEIIAKLHKEYEDAIAARDSYNKVVNSGLYDAVQSINEIVELVNENVKALSLSKKLKSEPKVNMHGEEHPRYRNDIDNNSLIADYQSGMILKDLSDKYHISIPGVRNRLMDLGVYKQVYKKN